MVIIRKAKSLVRRLLRLVRPATPPLYGFFGDYGQWEDVLAQTSSYETQEILGKVSTALAQVRDGEAVYERDSFIFDEIQYSWPLLSCLLRVGGESNNKLNLIDFGGSLGSTFYQNIHFLKGHLNIHWTIIEQKLFVEHGKKHFENDQLHFAYDLKEAQSANKDINTLLVSSTLQYLKEPYKHLQEWVDSGFEYLIFDRTTFTSNNKDRLTLQVVPPYIYTASYPAWFFSEEKFLSIILEKYDLISQWEALGKEFPIYDKNKQDIAQDKGFFFKKKS